MYEMEELPRVAALHREPGLGAREEEEEEQHLPVAGEQAEVRVAAEEAEVRNAVIISHRSVQVWPSTFV
jgi:hypothetical protein